MYSARYKGVQPWTLVTSTRTMRPRGPGPSLGLGLTCRYPTRTTKAWESSFPPRRESGHIQLEKNEGLLFIGSLFPINVSNLLLWRHLESQPYFAEGRQVAGLLKRYKADQLPSFDPIRPVKQALARPGARDLPIQVTQIVPRLKDGGAFVKFRCQDGTNPEEVETALNKALRSQPVIPWFNPFQPVRASLVQGVPWIEDLMRPPMSRIKVEFIPADADGTAVELSQEHLYSLFRRHGKIAEITSQASDSKTSPRFAYIDFSITRDAVMAKNCLHGLVIGAKDGGGRSGTLLRLGYEGRQREKLFWNWLKSHPRVVIPIIAAAVATFTVIVFDPIRTFFVKTHIQNTLKLSHSQLYKWFKSQTWDFLPGNRRNDNENNRGTIWKHRKDGIANIRSWLMDTDEGVVVIQGPRGSGKRELLDQATNGRDMLVIDAMPIVHASGDSATITKIAQAVGYRPIFGWANSLSSLVDLAVQSMTGAKSSFSDTLETKIASILQTTGSALKMVALDRREAGNTLSDDNWLEAHPEHRPIVVVENFHSTTRGGNRGIEETTEVLNGKLAEWFAALVHSNVAHVVVLVEDASAAGKTLTKAMPSAGYRTVILGDLSPAVAREFVLSRLDDGSPEPQPEERIIQEPKVESQFGSWFGLKRTSTVVAPDPNAMETAKRRELCKQLDKCIPVLGGRLDDLELLARRIRSGQDPQIAVADIISQASSDLLKMFLLTRKQEADRKWSPEQAWYLIQRLADVGSLRYNQVVVSSKFADTGVPGVRAEEALDALVSEELIDIKGSASFSASPNAVAHIDDSDDIPLQITEGRPVSIKPGRPVYRAAFQSLAMDRALGARMEMSVLALQGSKAKKDIDAAETELSLLASVGRTKETAGRSMYLAKKIEGAQMGIEEAERRKTVLTRVLGRAE